MPDQLIASRYRVVRELGRGGMGVVYLVEHVRTGDQLALKLLYGQGARNEQVIERFKREARASARIKSEHIVKVVDADVAPELEGAPFLVMELLNGTDLQKQIETKGRLPPDQAIHYLTQAARALDKSHQMGIVHRDLKPENLFIHHREDGTTILKIVDFGISKVLGSDAGNDITGAGMTSTGAVMGTPLYMSPEQARGRVSEIGPTTDVWAMGLICLQVLSGEVYWRANTVAELMSQILSEPMYAPSQRWPWMPQAVDSWFARSCARDQKERFQSVGQQIDALAVALGLRTAPAALPESSAPWSAVSPVPAAPSAAAIPGVRTTTSATAQEPSTDGEPRRSRAPLFVALAVVVLGGAGATAWAFRPHDAAVPALAASTPPSAQASVAPGAGPSSDTPAATTSAPPAASSPIADAGAPAKDAAAANVRQGQGRPQAGVPPIAQPQHPAAPVAPPVQPSPQAQPPQQGNHPFNPAAP